MHGPINVKSPNNTSKWQMEFNSAFKELNNKLNPICHLLALLGAHPILHVSRIRVNMVLPSILSHKQTAFISCTLFKASACIFVCAVNVLLSLTIIIHTKHCLSFVRHVYIVTNARFSFICVCLSVRMHMSARLLLAGFLWNWILEILWKPVKKLHIW
jgi:hypothetical protein